jgi:hypothetical protein
MEEFPMRSDDDEFSTQETSKRRDEVIKRMLNTPPQPRRAKQPKETKKRPARKAPPKLPS